MCKISVYFIIYLLLSHVTQRALLKRVITHRYSQGCRPAGSQEERQTWLQLGWRGREVESQELISAGGFIKWWGRDRAGYQALVCITLFTLEYKLCINLWPCRGVASYHKRQVVCLWVNIWSRGRKILQARCGKFICRVQFAHKEIQLKFKRLYSYKKTNRFTLLRFKTGARVRVRKIKCLKIPSQARLLKTNRNTALIFCPYSSLIFFLHGGCRFNVSQKTHKEGWLHRHTEEQRLIVERGCFLFEVWERTCLSKIKFCSGCRAVTDTGVESPEHYLRLTNQKVDKYGSENLKNSWNRNINWKKTSVKRSSTVLVDHFKN